MRHTPRPGPRRFRAAFLVAATLGIVGVGCSRRSPEAPTRVEARGAPGAIVATDAPTAPAAPAREAAKPPEPECFTETFQHPKAQGHARASDCLNHRNLVRFAREIRDARSVCVRVDGTPVRFKTVPGAKGRGVAGAEFGPVAGPESVITVRYCTEKKRCDSECKIPKDEFLAAIGGEDEADPEPAGRPGRVARWDPSEPDEGDVSEEVERELRKELHGDPDVKPFEGWKSGGATPACEPAKG